MYSCRAHLWLLGLAALGASSLCSSLAHAQQETSPQTWAVTVGGDVDDENGYRVDLGLAWIPSERTTWTVLAGRSDASSDFNEFSSSSASISFDHSFGTMGLSADARWWGDSDIVDSRALGASLYLDAASWRVAARGELRQSDFEPFDFDAVVPVRTPQGIVLVPISGTADCDLDNSAVGLSAGYSGEAWGFSVGGTSYAYDDTQCTTRNVTLPPQIQELPRISREIFRRIAARVVDTTSRLIGTQLTRENGFLDSTLQASMHFNAGEWTWAADYFHDREEFEGFQSDTLVGSVTLPLGDRADLELRAGATDSDLTGTVAFAGLTFFFYLGAN